MQSTGIAVNPTDDNRGNKHMNTFLKNQISPFGILSSILFSLLISQSLFAKGNCPKKFVVNFSDIAFEKTASISDSPVSASESETFGQVLEEIEISSQSLGYSFLNQNNSFKESFVLDIEIANKCIYKTVDSSINDSQAEIFWFDGAPNLRVGKYIGVQDIEDSEVAFIVKLVTPKAGEKIELKIGEEPAAIFSNEIFQIEDKNVKQWIFLGKANKTTFQTKHLSTKK